jgi:hypothetical protein
MLVSLAKITVKISITSIKSLVFVIFECGITLSISIQVGLHSTKDAMKLMNAACFVLKVASDIGNVTTNLIIKDTFVDLSFTDIIVVELLAEYPVIIGEVVLRYKWEITDILVVIGRWS